MARWFRVWQKKRGGRRTGSRLAGSVGEATFFGLLLLLGAIVQVYVFVSYAQAPSVMFLEPPVGFQFWLMVLISTSFLLIGGGGLVFAALQTGTSTERRAVLTKRAADLELGNEDLPPPDDNPGVPDHAHLTDSPGVKLRYRLPVISNQVFTFLAAATFCLVYNAILVVLLVVLIRAWLVGNPQILLAALALCFMAIGSWSIAFFLKQLRMRGGIGPTTVEISDHPLHPGDSYDVYLSQSGRLHLQRLEMLLVCEEEATFRQGTDVRTDRRVVFQQSVCACGDCQILRDQPYEDRGRLQIPSRTMHSFQGQHNVIQWKLVVRGQGVTWRTFERGFPIVISPPVGK